MAKIESPNGSFTGTRLGIQFKDGKAETRDERAIDWFRSGGYTVDGVRGVLPAPVVELPPTPGTPANPEGITRAPWSNDAAVVPNAGGPYSDAFMPPTNVGADPHGPLVVSPGLHAVPPAPIAPGPVAVDDPPEQERRETEIAQAVLVEGALATEAIGTPSPPAVIETPVEPAASADAEIVAEDRPAKRAKIDAWRAFAVGRGLTGAEADALTKDELIARFGG